MDTSSENVRRIVVGNPLEPQRRLVELLPMAGRTIAEVLPAHADASWLVLHNGRETTADEWTRILVRPHDEILCSPRIRKSALTKAVVGFVLPPLGLYYGMRAMGVNRDISTVVASGGLALLMPSLFQKKPKAPSITTPTQVQDSPTYGFQGIQNSTEHGAPIPIVYGTHRCAGQIVNTYVKTQNDIDTLYMLVAVSEGPVLSLGAVEINDQPVTNYSGVEVETRTGTPNQAPIFMLAGESTTFYSVDLQVTQAGSIYQTKDSVSGVEVKITCPQGLYYTQPADGSLMSWVAPILIEIRRPVQFGGTGVWYHDASARPQAAQRSPVRRIYRLGAVEGNGIYEIRVSRTAPDSTNQYQQDQTFFEGINEIRGDRYAYPNTALVGVKALATNQLSGGLPRVTCAVTGRFLWVLAAAGTHTWSVSQPVSDTPAWIVLDLLTNERYGFGRFCFPVIWNAGTATFTSGSPNFSLSGAGIPAGTIRRGMKIRTVNFGVSYIATIQSFNSATQTGVLEETFPGGTFYVNWPYAIHRDDLDLQSFVEWAAYTDTLITNPQGVTTKRCAINYVLDSSGAIWDVAQRLAQLGMATLVKVGTYVYARVEKQETPVQVFTMGNIVKGSYTQSYQSMKDRVNVVTGRFRNAAKRYENDFVLWEDPKIITDREQPRPLDMDLSGVTDYAAASRLVRLAVNKNRLLRRTITFEVGLELLRCQPFDVITVQHDIPQWGFGSRCAAGSTVSIVQLDHSVTLEAGVIYSLLIRRNATDQIEERTVTTSPSTTSTLSVSPPFSFAPAKDDLWAFGAQGIAGKPFRILSIERTPDLNGKISAIEYVADVYLDVNPDDVVLTNYSQLPDVKGPPGPVRNLTLSVLGTARDSVWVGFEPPGSINFREGFIYREVGPGSYTYLGRSANGTFAIQGIASGETLVIRVTSVSTTGAESAVSGAPRASLLVSFALPMPTGLNLVYEGSTPYLLWSHVQWYRPIWYEIRRGNQWESGVFVARVPGGINRASIAVNGMHWVAVVDDAGSWSEPSDPFEVGLQSLEQMTGTATLHTLMLPDPLSGWSRILTPHETQGLVEVTSSFAAVDDVGPPETIDELPDWDSLRLSVVKFQSLGDWDSVTDVDALADIDSVGGGYNVHAPLDTLYGTGVTFTDGTEAVVTVRMSYSYVAESPIQTWDDVPDVEALPDSDLEWSRFVRLEPLLAVVTSGNMSGAFQAYQDGDYRGWHFLPALRFFSDTPFATPALTSWRVEMTTKERGTQQASVAVPAEGLRLWFNPPYVVTPNIQVTLVNAPAGAEVDIAEQSTTGAVIRIRVEGLFRAGTVNYSIAGR